MLISFGLPQNLWGEAILSANYILNKVPRKKVDKTSYELWKGVKHSYKFLRMWGCLAKVAILTPKWVRIGPKSVDCIFIGYIHNSRAYRFLVHKSEIPDIHRNTIMESRNAWFLEAIFPCRTHAGVPRSLEQFDELASEDDHVDDAGDEQIEVIDEPRRSKRARISKSFGPDF